MPNPTNFEIELTSLAEQRPYRLSSADQGRVVSGQKFSLFGTTEKDNVELWFYYPDGTFAATTIIPVVDPSVRLMTLLGPNNELYEYISLNLERIVEHIKLDAGRYTVSAYFLRDEIGSRDGNKLYIKKISSSRKELILSSQKITSEMTTEIKDFVIPSTSPQLTKGLTDQVFGKNVDVVDDSEQITADKVLNEIKDINGEQTIQRMGVAGAMNWYNEFFEDIKDRIYQRMILKIVENKTDRQITTEELDGFFEEAIDQTLTEYTSWIDPRISIEGYSGENNEGGV